MEEIIKHRGFKEKDHPHQHMHLFHFHHHHHPNKDQQQNVIVEKYREVSSAIDEPIHGERAGSPSVSTGVRLKITVCRKINQKRSKNINSYKLIGVLNSELT